jgi:hypothetical protein
LLAFVQALTPTLAPTDAHSRFFEMDIIGSKEALMPNENEKQNKNAAQPKYPLAYDVNGTPFIPPPSVVAWRVFKLAKKGAGRPTVMRESGRPLELSLLAGFDGLVDAVGESGRYRLEGIDAEGRPVPGCVAVTEVVFDDDVEDAKVKTAFDALPVLVQLVEKLVASNVQVVEAMASAFGPVRPPAPAPIVTMEQPPAAQSADVLGGILKVVDTLKGMKNGTVSPSSEGGAKP